MKTLDQRKRSILESFRHGLIVSCQVQPDDPIFSEEMPVKMAQATQWGGAVGIRANTPEQIRAIEQHVDLPVIGLYKIWKPGTDVFITPTLEAAKAVYEAGAEIIALDCTEQMIDGRHAYELLPEVKAALPDAILFADVSNYREAQRAVELGADIVGPTLYGYTADTKEIELPDLREFARMCRDLGDEAYIIMEGHNPKLKVRGWIDPLSQDRPPRGEFEQCECLSDLIHAIETDTKPTLDPNIARYVVDIMCTIPQAVEEKRTLPLHTTF